MRISIIVPCYNEEEALPFFFEAIKEVIKELEKNYTVELIFVDDGSKDNTLRLLKNLYKENDYVKVVIHRRNKNVGSAIRTGFRKSSGDLIVLTDCDGTYPPDKIPEIITLLESDVDIVTASPYHPLGDVGGIPKYRLFLSQSINSLYSLLLNTRIYTFTALFRVIRRDTIDKVTAESNDFVWFAEIIAKSVLKGYKVREYPTKLYIRKYGVSKMWVSKIIVNHIKFLSSLSFMIIRSKS